MERFPALDLVVRFGALGAIGVAALAALGCLIALWSSWGWLAIGAAGIAGAFVYLVCKCAVEMVTIVTEMLVPR